MMNKSGTHPSTDASHQRIIDEILLYLRYAVADHEQEEATAFVEALREHLVPLRLLREYYCALPEPSEEPVVKLATLSTRQGVRLMVVCTRSRGFLYLVSVEDIVLIGAYGEEVANDIYTYFGYDSQKAFLKSCVPLEELKPFSTSARQELVCPACGVAKGEFHLLGCIVELCPWCQGQLCSCNCRFEQLDTEEIEDDEQLAAFEELLEEKGRIPFSEEQAPSYPGTSKGLDV